MADCNFLTEAEAFEMAAVEYYAAEEHARALRLEAAPEEPAPSIGGLAACFAISITEQNGFQHLLPREWGGTAA